MPDLAYVNGEIMPIEKAVVPIEDRGYQFGDGVYEFVASYEGQLFMLEAHLDRAGAVYAGTGLRPDFPF
jgi:D-alanine transaminase